MENSKNRIDPEVLEEQRRVIETLRTLQRGDGIVTIGYATLTDAYGCLADKVIKTLELLDNGQGIPDFCFFDECFELLDLGALVTLIGHGYPVPTLWSEINENNTNPSENLNPLLKRYVELELLSQFLFIAGDVIRIEAFELFRTGSKQSICDAIARQQTKRETTET